jgi:hypothetical protein
MYVSPAHYEDAFTCPHCQVYTSQFWADLTVERIRDHRDRTGATPISRSTCFNCGKSAYWFDERMIMPANVDVEMPSPDLPDNLKPDYMEAREIFNYSPKRGRCAPTPRDSEAYEGVGRVGKRH